MYQNCGLCSEPMKKMLLKLVLFWLCLWRPVGEFEMYFFIASFASVLVP